MYKNFKYSLFYFALFCTGCSDEPIPEASKTTCSDQYYSQVKAKINNEVAKKNFEDECSSLKLAEKVTDWEFVPSKESKY